MKASLAILILGLFASTLSAQTQDPPPPLSAIEKEFQEAMTNVTLTGFFTVGDSGDPHDDRYIIERVVKIASDLWNFDARILYNKKDYKATVKVPVKWAGETPVMMLQNYLIQGQGVFSARILIHNGMYAGTWGSQKQGGKMFGKIVRNEATPAQPPATALPEPPPQQKQPLP